MKTIWTASFLYILAAFFLLTGIALADPPGCGGKMMPIPTEHLHFNLDTAAVFIPQTTELDTIATVAFSLYFDEDYLDSLGNTDNISDIVFTFKYCSSDLEFVGFYKDSTNWDGDIDTTYTNISGDTTEIQFLLDQGDVEPPTSYQNFAYIEFKPACQSGSYITDLVFCGLGNDNEVIMGQHYFSLDKDKGGVEIDEYEVTLWIQSDSLTGGALGTEFTVPVYWKNNFYASIMYNYIIFDTLRLQLTGFWPADSSDWDFFKNCYQKADTLLVALTNGSGNHADQYSDSILVYTFKFKALYEDTAWESDSTKLEFLTGKTAVAAYSCGYVDNYSFGHTDGTIKIAPYEAALTYHFADDPIGYQDSLTSIWVQIKNSYPIGETTNSIMINLDLGDDFNDADLADNYTPDEAIKFTFGTYDAGGGNLQARIRQEYEVGIDNYWSASDTFKDFFKVDLEFDYDNYTPSFEERFLKLNFLKVFNSHDTMHVDDTTGSVTATLDNGKLDTLTTDSLEIMLGEFYAPERITINHDFHQSIYVRNTFDVDSFNVTINIEGDNMKISAIFPEDSIHVTKINDYSYTIYCHPGNGPQANGDEYTGIACVMYQMKPGCTSGEYYYDSVWFSDAYMDDHNDNQPFLFLEGNDIRGKCGGMGEFCPIGQGKLADNDTDIETSVTASLLPNEFKLHPNRPNPFNPFTAVLYDVPVAAHVRIDIYNILGQKVKTLVDEVKVPGTHEVLWNGTDEHGIQVSTGIYLYNMQAGEFRQSRKMMLMK